MKHLRIAVIVFAIAAFPLVGFAQEGEQKVTEYDMKDVDVDGATPEVGEMLESTLHDETDSLIDVRRNFVPEMMKSVDEI